VAPVQTPASAPVTQAQIDALHLLSALLSQEGSIVITILQKLGVDAESLTKKVDTQILKIPAISTPQAFGQFYLTQDMAKVLDRARQEAIKMNDEFISVEHLFLALVDTKSTAKDILEKINFSCVNGFYFSFTSDTSEYSFL